MTAATSLSLGALTAGCGPAMVGYWEYETQSGRKQAVLHSRDAQGRIWTTVVQEDHYLTLDESAVLIGVNRSTVYKWLRDGRVFLPGFAMGGVARVPNMIRASEVHRVVMTRHLKRRRAISRDVASR